MRKVVIPGTWRIQRAPSCCSLDKVGNSCHWFTAEERVCFSSLYPVAAGYLHASHRWNTRYWSIRPDLSTGNCWWSIAKDCHNVHFFWLAVFFPSLLSDPPRTVWIYSNAVSHCLFTSNSFGRTPYRALCSTRSLCLFLSLSFLSYSLLSNKVILTTA